MWLDNAKTEWNALLSRISSLEASRVKDEIAITQLQSAIKTLQTSTNLILSRKVVSDWTHKDYGLGTDIGDNNSGAGLLLDHASVIDRSAVGMTVTPTSHASPFGDSVYLWEPSQQWNYVGQEWWLRTSFLFPKNIVLFPGEAPFQPTTGEANWFLELHNDSNPTGPTNIGQEYANICFNIMTDYPIGSGVGQNPRIQCRLLGGPDSAIQSTYITADGKFVSGFNNNSALAGIPLEYDRWYEFLLHVKLDPVSGIFEWFLDGKLIYSNTNIPTLYSRPIGYVSPSYTSLTITNYRLHATWNSTILMGPLTVSSVLL